MSWLRWWSGTVNDPKWRLIANRAKCRPGDCVAVWAYLLELAKDASGDVSRADAEECAVVLGYEPEAVQAIISAMQDRKLIDAGRLPSWERRQPKREDDSKDRVAAYRERQKTEKTVTDQGAEVRNTHVTHGNAPESESEKKEVRLDETREADALVSLVLSEAVPAESPIAFDPLGTSVCLGWLRSGYDPALDVVPAVKKAMTSQKFPIKRWDSLTQWVRNAHADRMSAEMARPPPDIRQKHPIAKPKSVIDALKSIQDVPQPPTKPYGAPLRLSSDGDGRSRVHSPSLSDGG